MQTTHADNIDAEHQAKLLSWYKANRRDLPWRRTRDPYAIWISETMLQQTTTQAVIPFYERFLRRFPTLKNLAHARVEDVFEVWAGLGYYSRARNLHRAAQSLLERFPKRASELQELPGFGPYTSRAVASIAFGEAVGVLDGNVIRVLSRLHDLETEWWRPAERRELQRLADRWVQGVASRDLNQAWMDLGRTICVPQNPTCLLCPLSGTCKARDRETVNSRPLKKPRRTREIWLWNVQVMEQRGRVLLCRDLSTPFLKNHWILPGKAVRLRRPPKEFHFRHSVTHHDIFVTIQAGRGSLYPSVHKWVPRSELSRHVPASLVKKALEFHLSLQSGGDRVPQAQNRKRRSADPHPC